MMFALTPDTRMRRNAPCRLNWTNGDSRTTGGYATHFHLTLLDIYAMDADRLGPLNARKVGYVSADGKKYKGYHQPMREAKTFRSSEDAVRWVVEQDQYLNDRTRRREAENAKQTKKLREEWV